jgi:hypothetical protein
MDFSINEKVFENTKLKGKPVLFMGNEIILDLAEQLKEDNKEHGSQSVQRKVILIVTDSGPNLVSSTELFSMYHAMIAQTFSFFNNKTDIEICGGGYIKLSMNSSITIGGKSDSFGKMNKNYLLKIIRQFLPSKVELVDSYQTEETISRDFRKFTYSQIFEIVSNI